MVRRQILEGVLAIVRLDTTGLTKGKVSVQIFDRRGGANNVQFNGKQTFFWVPQEQANMFLRICRPRSDNSWASSQQCQTDPIPLDLTAHHFVLQSAYAATFL